MANTKSNLLPRGFKSRAEKLSLQFRNQLNIAPHEPLSAFDLAESMGIKIYTPEELSLQPIDISNIIGSSEKPSGWSALTMITEAENQIIIHNGSHSAYRQQSNIMHELAHIICEHKRSNSNSDIAVPFFMMEYDPVQEEEAKVLGAALAITRTGLLWALKQGMRKNEIAEYYTASEEMVTYRINSTGVSKQLKYLTIK